MRRSWLGYASLVSLFATGCSSQPTAEPVVMRNHPRITIEKPSYRDKAKAWKPLAISGSVVVGEGEWTPGVLVVEINGDRQGRLNFGSYATEPEKSDTPGRYTFNVTLKAPQGSGRYFIRITGIGAGKSPARPGSKSGESEVMKHSELLEFEVAK